jgi:hypothetical protein
VIENSGYGADKFTMVRNGDGTGSLKIVQPLDYEDQLQSNGFRFRIQVNDKVSVLLYTAKPEAESASPDCQAI